MAKTKNTVKEPDFSVLANYLNAEMGARLAAYPDLIEAGTLTREAANHRQIQLERLHQLLTKNKYATADQDMVNELRRWGREVSASTTYKNRHESSRRFQQIQIMAIFVKSKMP